MEPCYKWNEEFSNFFNIFYQRLKIGIAKNAHIASAMLMMPTLELCEEQTYVV